MCYKIISSHEMSTLSRYVNEAINEGFLPVGGLNVIHHEPSNKNTFYQAVAKLDKGNQ